MPTSSQPVADAHGAFLIVNPDPDRGQFSSIQIGLREVLNRGRDAAFISSRRSPARAARQRFTLCAQRFSRPIPNIWAVVPEACPRRFCRPRPSHPGRPRNDGAVSPRARRPPSPATSSTSTSSTFCMSPSLTCASPPISTRPTTSRVCCARKPFPLGPHFEFTPHPRIRPHNLSSRCWHCVPLSPSSIATARSGAAMPVATSSIGRSSAASSAARSQTPCASVTGCTKSAKSAKSRCAARWSPCIAASRSTQLHRAAKNSLSKSCGPAYSPRCRNSPTGWPTKVANSGRCHRPTTGWSKPERRAFGIARDHVLAACVHVEDGRATNRLLRVPTDELKALAIREVIGKPVHAVFGNSIHDHAMLEIAAYPFCINPNPDLQQVAKQKNWPIYWPSRTE